jgi:hypothetical protein
MARPKKNITSGTAEHAIRVEMVKSVMMNRNLYEPVCSCGWEGPRWGSEIGAREAGEVHANSF